MINSGKSPIIWAVAVAITGSAQIHRDPVAANLCEVVASPGDYNNKVLSLEGILLPSEHSLALFSPSCKPREGFNVTIQAVLPDAWESSHNGRQLRQFLRRGKKTAVKLTGIFESGGGPYGPDGAMFRFVISEISWVKKPSVP